MANWNTCQIGGKTRAGRCEQILRGTAAVVAAAVAATAIGCATRMTPPPPVDSPAAYRVGAPDKLAIQILPEPAISTSVTVRPDGIITVPLIGEVKARDRTISEIAAEVEERIARYKRDPHVTVTLVGAASTDVVILGEVRRPGNFPLVKETRVLEAIAMVGGTMEFGWDSRIRLIRTENGVTKRMRVQLNKIRRGDLTTNVMLQPGDFVYVPPTPWAQFGYALNALLFPFQPFMGLGHSALGRAIFP